MYEEKEAEMTVDLEASEMKAAAAAGAEPDLAGESMRQLPAGQTLSLEEAGQITAHEPSKFVVIIGENGCGKTTLVTSLYQMFLRCCRVGGFFFADSKTLAAFEDRAFYTRIVCYGRQPETMRTHLGAQDILHLKIHEQDHRKTVNLLLSDFSGEDFKQIIADPVAARENFLQIEAARRIVVLIDGEKLSETKERMAEIQQAIYLLKTFCDSELIGTDAEIIIAVSKYDLICALPEDDRKRICDLYRDKIKRQFPELLDRMEFLETAAMPSDKKLLEPYYGLEQLLELLLKNKAKQETPRILPVATSQFDLWAERAKK